MSIYYIQINEIQGENIDGITCIFRKVLFSLVKNTKSVIKFTSEKYQLLTSTFSISFLCKATVSQNFRRL